MTLLSKYVQAENWDWLKCSSSRDWLKIKLYSYHGIIYGLIKEIYIFDDVDKYIF